MTEQTQDLTRRVKAAAAIFTRAAEHYGRGERAAVALLLAQQVEEAAEPVVAAFDLAAAGAIANGFVLSEFEHRCDLGCDVDAQEDVTVFAVAEEAINAAADDEWNALDRVLNAAFDELTGEQLRTLVMVLVAVYSKVTAA